MSEDRFERALHEMSTEDVDDGTIETARARVWENVTNVGNSACAEFRQDFRGYLGNELGASRRTLLEDHLSRCTSCRTRIAEMKGERTVIAMPVRSSSRWVWARRGGRNQRWKGPATCSGGTYQCRLMGSHTAPRFLASSFSS